VVHEDRAGFGLPWEVIAGEFDFLRMTICEDEFVVRRRIFVDLVVGRFEVPGGHVECVFDRDVAPLRVVALVHQRGDRFPGYARVKLFEPHGNDAREDGFCCRIGG
jgi:hypothetical protein